MLGSVTWAVDTAAVGPAAALVGLAQRPTHHLLDRRHVLHQLAAAFAQGRGGKILENHRIASKGCPTESEGESSVNPFVTALQASHKFSELNQAKRVDKQRLVPGRRRSARRRSPSNCAAWRTCPAPGGEGSEIPGLTADGPSTLQMFGRVGDGMDGLRSRNPKSD